MNAQPDPVIVASAPQESKDVIELMATKPVNATPVTVAPPSFHTICRYCNCPIESTFFYCPVCGKKLKEPPVSTTILAQALAYCVSIFLPPLGLGYTFKYLKQSEPKARIIGWITLFLTVISIIVTLKLSLDLFSSMSNSINSQMQNYSNLGL
jgi:hypothetical protein